MKKVTTILQMLLVVVIFSGLYACLKNEDTPEASSVNSLANESGLSAADRSEDDAIPVPCGIWFSGSWGSSTQFGYHVYTDRLLDLTDFESTDMITVSVLANEVPNRFQIRTLGGALITETPWLGAANFEPAPCLTGNVSTNSTYNLTFQRGSNVKVLLRVETCSNAGISDTWSAYYACPPGIDNDCGKLFSGSWAGPGYHIYPDLQLNLVGVTAGTWICLQCNSVEVPNRFDVKNYKPGTEMITTNWIGASNFLPQVCWDVLEPSPKTIRFQKVAGYDHPVVSIITCPPADQQDSWLLSVSCDCVPRKNNEID